MKKRITNHESRITKARRSPRAGFTLVELIMTIVIVGILAGMGVPLAFNLFESFQYSIYRKDLSASGDAVLRRMSREIRRIRNDTSVITANPSAYSFVVNDEQDPDNIQHAIQFELNGTNLERKYDRQTDILAANVSSFSFTYYDDRGTVITSPLAGNQPTDIRFIEINMTLESNNNTIDYKTQIRPWNVTHLSDLFS